MAPNEGGTALVAKRSRPLLHYKDLGLVLQNRKVRLTCVHMSENFFACGANNGSVYLYAVSSLSRNEGDRIPAKYHLVKTISPPSNDRVPVTCLSICPLQKRLLVGTVRGIVYAIHLSDYHKIGEKVEFSHDFHAGFPITCFLWDKRGTRLFSACNAGRVCQTVLRAGVSAFFGSTDTELLLKEESGIVQLDLAKSEQSYILMVSSQSRVLLLNLTSGDGSAVQIGTKARQGSYGACFFTSLNAESIDPAKRRETKVFSSRPGRRVWVADPQSGLVSSTLKFSLGTNPTQFLQSPDCAMEEGIRPRNLSINKLGLFRSVLEPPYAPQDVKEANPLLVSWNVGSSVLFFLDPSAVEIIEWHLDLGIIHDLQVVDDTTLVILHGDAPKVSMIESCSAGQFLQIYSAGDVNKACELAIQFNINDATVLEALQIQWLAHLDENASVENEQLSSSLEALVRTTMALKAEYTAATQSYLSNLTDSQPLQIVLKQRPRQGSQVYSQSDTFADQIDIKDTDVTLRSSNLHKSVEYYDVLASSDHTYSKFICAPDGSFVEAKLVEIPELPRSVSVLADDSRNTYMEEVLDEVKKSEITRNEEGGMNLSLLPVLKGGTSVAAKAFSAFIPRGSMFTHLMDGSMIPNSLGHPSASGIFGEYPELDDADLVIDMDPRLLKRSFTPGQRLTTDTNECSVLRIAMSTIGEADESNLDTEVLMEAISMDIWDSKLKYTSNLPIKEQLNLLECGQDSNRNGAVHAPTNTSANNQELKDGSERMSTLRDSSPSQINNLTLQIPDSKDSSSETNTSMHKLKSRLIHRASMSPDARRAAQRAIHNLFGAAPGCEIKLKCMVGGRIAVSSELESSIRRDVSELVSELHAATTTAEKTKELTRRLWPASGITRVCACLSSMYLLQGDMNKVQATISAWLNCFDPTQHDYPKKGDDERIDDRNISYKNSPGFARGEALIDGDGLPLTRGDWNLVRTLVSIFFAIWAAGTKLLVHPLNWQDHGDGKCSRMYESEMGVKMTLKPRYIWTSDDSDFGIEVATADEAKTFVGKYGAYINPDLAAEVCNLRQFTGALRIVLDKVVSSADMEEVCDSIVSCISEKDSGKALLMLKECDSLCLLLHLLDIFLKRCPKDTIELCVNKYPVLYPWNIEQALFGVEFNYEAVENGVPEILKPATVVQTSKYFRYLLRLLETKGDEAGKDAQVVSRCLDLCFAGSGVVGEVFDNDERPSCTTWVATLVRQPDKFVYDHSKCWNMFVDHKALLALIELTMLSLQSHNDAALLQRGFDELSMLVTLIVNSEELVNFIAVFKRVAVLPHVSEECFSKILNQIQASLSVSNNERLCSAVIHALLNSVDLEYGVRVLARYPMLVDATPMQTYHMIVEAQVLTKRQKHEMLRILEIVDSNVWASYKENVSARSSVSFAPQLAAILQLEMGEILPAMSREQYELWSATCEHYDKETTAHRTKKAERTGVDVGLFEKLMSFHIPNSLSGASLACRSFEYRNSDWGGEVQLHDSTCRTCELPVVIISDDTNLDVVLLPCGHAYHKFCLEDNSCPACLETNLSTVMCTSNLEWTCLRRNRRHFSALAAVHYECH
ncbi:hypothetical protein F443_04405 [Plasmopara halstedii]|uniref:RING-type domain-containing protein n=1 Tax=Plasmopara halstedii TaxID=4781 RepID=A0A0P1AUA2_PLAHL|nr:hypothetical protein F443_04405 [Plasmopara halstedii]CEG44935.1 hypothetical protein F443_04405 [Plasmopara halstedii]|eukprot:XP_024581304.1 hypothetical protein F443_04405 [Plasmopara halstedii]